MTSDINTNTTSTIDVLPHLDNDSPIHEHVNFIHNYNLPHIKEIIRDSKLLKSTAINHIAQDMYKWILGYTTQFVHHQYTDTIPLVFKILIIHSPSTTYAEHARKHDQLALICERIKYYFEYSPATPFQNTQFIQAEVLPHIFLIARAMRSAQHHKNKADRLLSSKNRFSLVNHSPPFRRLLNTYQMIYIIDDVVTTGSTLNELRSIITPYIDSARTTTTLLSFSH